MEIPNPKHCNLDSISTSFKLDEMSHLLGCFLDSADNGTSHVANDYFCIIKFVGEEEISSVRRNSSAPQTYHICTNLWYHKLVG